MHFKTNISKTEKNEHTIRGQNLADLIKEKSFTDVLFLLWQGDLPSQNEKSLLEALLVSSVENGIEAPTIFVPRISASVGNKMHVALASGLLAMGESHGGAAEKCAEILVRGLSIDQILTQYNIVPGFGHKVYKDKDPRAEAIYKRAKDLGFSCTFFDRAYEIQKELERKTGKKIPLNVDGAIAASILELKLKPVFGKAIFALARVGGMAGHVAEEYEQKNSYYRLDETDVEK